MCILTTAGTVPFIFNFKYIQQLSFCSKGSIGTKYILKPKQYMWTVIQMFVALVCINDIIHISGVKCVRKALLCKFNGYEGHYINQAVFFLNKLYYLCDSKKRQISFRPLSITSQHV